MTTHSKRPNILLIEGDARVADLIIDSLKADNFDVVWQRNGNQIAENIKSSCPVLVLLDAMLPDTDGYAICQQIRGYSQIPIIILSAKNQESDRLLGFELGADDYICKPFSPRELVFRVRAILKRTAGFGSQLSLNPKLDLEATTYKAKFNGQPLGLTPIEFRILATLAQSPGRIFTRNDLLDRAYPGHRAVNDRTIDTHIKNLRRKLGAVSSSDEIVHSIYGVGYKLEINNNK